jgi:hypothetical protein
VPIIPPPSGLPILAEFVGQGTLSVAAAVDKHFSATIIGDSGLSVDASVVSENAIVMNGYGTMTVFGRLNSDPNVFGSAAMQGVGSLQPTGRLKFNGHAQMQGSATVVVAANTFGQRVDVPVYYDIFPNVAANANIQVVNARFKINGVEAPIRAFRYAEAAATAGTSLSIELSRPILSEVPIGSDFTFEIYSSGAWETKMTGTFGNRQYAVSFESDRLNISSVDSASDKLAKCPKKRTVFYDPSKTEVPNEEQSDVLRDNFGNAYPSEFVPSYGLSFYDLLQWALVTVCGFSSYKTDLPDFPVVVADFAIGKPVIETINALDGVFEPLVFERTGNVGWIKDTSVGIPSGSVARSLPISRFKSFNVTTGADAGNVDGLIINYSESTTGDFYTQRLEESEFPNEGGDFAGGTTELEHEFWDYKLSSDPEVIVSTILKSEKKTTKNAADQTIGEEITIRTVNSRGLVTGHEKTVKSMLPTDDFSSPALALRLESRERQRCTFTTDSLGRTYLSVRQTQHRALVAQSNTKTYLTQPWQCVFIEGHRAGILKAGMTVTELPTKTVTETFTRLANGQTTCSTTTVDHIRGGLTGSRNEAENGEAVIPNRHKQRQMILWRQGLTVNPADISQKKLKSINGGEIPMIYLKPLGYRKLDRLFTGKGEGSAELFGYDSSIRRGSTFNVTGRDDEDLGNFMTIGFDISGQGLGTEKPTMMTRLTLLEL